MAWEGVKYTLRPLHMGKLASVGTLNLEEVFVWKCLSCLCLHVYSSALCEEISDVLPYAACRIYLQCPGDKLI